MYVMSTTIIAATMPAEGMLSYTLAEYYLKTESAGF